MTASMLCLYAAASSVLTGLPSSASVCKWFSFDNEAGSSVILDGLRKRASSWLSSLSQLGNEAILLALRSNTFNFFYDGEDKQKSFTFTVELLKAIKPMF